MDVFQPGVLDGLFRTYSTKFKDAFVKTQPIWTKLAMLETSSSTETVYYISATRAKLEAWVGERRIRGMQALAYTIGNELFSDAIEMSIDLIADDNFGLFDKRTASLAQAAKLWPDEMVVGALQSGNSFRCVDGVNFFSDVHPVNPFRTEAGTWSNLVTGINGTFNEANFAVAYQNFRVIRGWDERVMKVVPDTLICGPALEDRVKRALFIPTVADPNGGNAPINNIHFGKIKNLVVLPELLLEPEVWYLAVMEGAEKPIVFQQRLAPTFEQISAPGSEYIIMNRKVVYTVTARGGVGYYLPHYCSRYEGV